MFAIAIDGGTYAARAIEAAFRIYMLPQGMFSVAVAAVLFPTLSRLVAAGDLRGLPRTGGERHPADRLPAGAGRGSLAPCSPSPSCGCSTSTGPGRRRTRRAPPRRCGVLARPRRQRRAAAAQPRLLLAAAGLAADLGRRSATSCSTPCCCWLLYDTAGVWGIPLATSISNLATGRRLVAPAARRASATWSCTRRSRRSRSWLVASGAARRGLLGDLDGARRRARRVDRGAGRQRRRRARRGRRRLPRRVAPAAHPRGRRSPSASCVVGPRAARRYAVSGDGPVPHPQLLDHRAHRPRQVDAGGSHPRDHATP